MSEALISRVDYCLHHGILVQYLATLADGRKTRFVNVNAELAGADGRLFEGMSADNLHPTLKAYQIWADALKPILLELLGPPAANDVAPAADRSPAARLPRTESPRRRE
jgi:hypothetical protein